MTLRFEEEIVIASIDNELVLLNLKSGKYFSLNETGKRMWELLKESGDTDFVLSEMQKEYNVDNEILTIDLNNLIEKLTSAQLVIPA